MTQPARYDFGDITVYIAPVERLSSESRSRAERRITDAVIRHALGDSVRVDRHPSGAPYLIGSDLFVSLSHSRRYVAVALSATGPVGIDVEEYRPQLDRVAPRILSDAELAVYADSEAGLLRAWTLKEALYKAALTPGLDFRQDIVLPSVADPLTAYVSGRKFSVLTFAVEDSTVALAALNQ